MSKEKKPRPVESFGPAILASLMKGAIDGLQLRITYRDAVRFRMRIHQLREAMRRTGHSQYELVARVRATIEYDPGTPVEKQGGRHWVPKDRSVLVTLRLLPNDSEFEAALKAIGVDPLAGVSPIVAPAHDESELDEFLKNLDRS